MNGTGLIAERGKCVDKRANEAWRKHLHLSDKKQSELANNFSKSSHLTHMPTMPMTVAAASRAGR